ncbi:hypothetical protein [Nodosilinea sp. E11]|uniref:hypothetical protein n=1 Tax=Nodosilinea sp. E11 TaxID=3037479 RepID=UPI0029351E8E|nr:hypothetical protein [Nodosilinea sp. E11]WOD40384.1 hypothetical protein RRF56_06200 [Nodosilinea sp. E11]
MTLAVGTVLKHGTYVIDAWVSEDTVGPVYLAMDVPRGQWIQLRVLGSRNPQDLPEALERQAFYQYLQQVSDLKHSVFPQCLGGFEEEGVCYQILASPTGTPLDRLVTADHPLPPSVSLALLRELIAALQALRPLGWTGLRLSPDQVWSDPEAKTTTFIGFDLLPGFSVAPSFADSTLADPAPVSSTSNNGDSDTTALAPTVVAPAEAALVRGLSDLLYFLLTGQVATATKAPLAVEVRRRYPALPRSLDIALEQGSPTGQRLPAIALADWAALLPDATSLPPDPAPVVPLPPYPVVPVTLVVPGDRIPGSGPSTQAIAPLSSTKHPSKKVLALGLTGLIATVSGLGIGLYARLQPASSASPERLNPNQSFPPQPGWNSNPLWQPWDDAPANRRRPDYGDTPPPGSEPVTDFVPNVQEPAAPPPAVSQPAPEPEFTPEPTEVWEAPAEPWVTPAPIEPVAPAPQPEVEPAPPPVAPPPPLEAPPLRSPTEGAAPPPLNAPANLSPRPDAPAPSSS